MIIWRGSLSRCGGTVCQHIIRWILARHGITPVRVGVDDIARILDGRVRRCGPDGIDLVDEQLKKLDTGYWLGGNDGCYTDIFHLPYFFVHFVRRDLRPTIVSHMRLTGVTFEKALDSLHLKMKLYDRFECLPNERCLRLDYEHDILNIANAAMKLSKFIGLPLESGEVDEVSGLFSKGSLSQRFRTEQDVFFEMMALYMFSDKHQVPRFEGDHFLFSMRHDGAYSTYRLPYDVLDENSLIHIKQGRLPGKIGICMENKSYDLNLNQDSMRPTYRAAFSVDVDGQVIRFQQRHISSGNEEDWRNVLSKQQIEQVNNASIPFLEKYGYPV